MQDLNTGLTYCLRWLGLYHKLLLLQVLEEDCQRDPSWSDATDADLESELHPAPLLLV